MAYFVQAQGTPQSNDLGGEGFFFSLAQSGQRITDAADLAPEIASFKGHSNPAKISTAEKEAK